MEIILFLRSECIMIDSEFSNGQRKKKERYGCLNVI